MESKTSLTLPSGSPLPASRSDRGQDQFAAQRAAILFGCYRKADANDPEIYTAAAAATLAEFSREAVEWVTDPRTGLPARLKWLPTIAEIREACESRDSYLKSRNELIGKGWIQRADGGWDKP